MQTQCPHCKSLYRLSPETIEAFGGFVRCGNCDYKFNVHDQVQVERDYFELSSEDALDEEMPLRLHSMGGIDDDEIAAPVSGRIEPALEVKDDGLNIRFNADEFGPQASPVNTPSNPKVEPRFGAADENQISEVQAVQPALQIETDTELQTGTERQAFTARDVSEDEVASANDGARTDSEVGAKPDAPVVEGEAETDKETRSTEDAESQTDASALNELERLLDTPDKEQRTPELSASETDRDADAAVSESESSVVEAKFELDQDDFSWGRDSAEESQDVKSGHIFDNDFPSLDNTPENDESDPLEAFTFSRERDEEMPDVAPQGEIHTLLTDEDPQHDPDAPGFIRRFVSGLGSFMIFGFWLVLSVGLVYLLIGQVRDRVYPQIKSEPVVQDIRSRVCSFLPCAKSKYDVDQYEIVVSRMDEVRDPDRQLHISIFLFNRSEQALVYPSIGITFKRLDGSTVGQRVIGPDEYSTSNNRVVIAGDGAGGVTKPLIKANKLGKVLIRFDNAPADAVGFEARVVP